MPELTFYIDTTKVETTFNVETNEVLINVVELGGGGSIIAIDNLDSASSTSALSANQGRILDLKITDNRNLIDNINLLLASDDTTLDELQEVVDFIKLNKTELDSLTTSNILGLDDALNSLSQRITELENNPYDDTALTAIAKSDVISFAMSSPTADLVTGDTDPIHAPYDFTLVSFFVGLKEAPTGSAAVFDLKKNGVSVTSSKAIIDSGETTSLTGTAPVLTGDLFFPKGTLITPSIFQVGALTTGKSAKIYLSIIKS